MEVEFNDVAVDAVGMGIAVAVAAVNVGTADEMTFCGVVSVFKRLCCCSEG